MGQMPVPTYLPPVLRPQLSPQQAAQFTRDRVLHSAGIAGAERADPWDPSRDVARPSMPDFIVDAQGTPGPHLCRSVGEAVSRAVRYAQATGRRRRIYIEIAPGRYEGLVYVPRLLVQGTNVPITLYARSADPTDTCLHANIDAEMPGAEYARHFGPQMADVAPEIKEIFQCIAARDKITTAHASVLRIEGDGCQIFGLTIQNTYNADRPQGDEAPGTHAGRFQQSTGQHQAVALLVAGADRVHGANLHLKSHQDTLYLQSPGPFSTVRSYFEACLIEGDVDFIFGQATSFFHRCEVKSLGARAPHAWATAPSTNLRTRYGLVFDDCDFTHDGKGNARKGTFSLGRQWFEGVRATPYGQAPVSGYTCDLDSQSAYAPPKGTISAATLEAVGKCVIVNSRIGAHINRAAPWDEWNGGRFDTDGTYHPGAWSARYRPVQCTAGDMQRLLGPWQRAQEIDLSDIDPAMVFLGEFNNRALADPAV